MLLRRENDDELSVGLRESGLSRHVLCYPERVRFVLGLHIGLVSGSYYDQVSSLKDATTAYTQMVETN
jgi:hypothetical protein